jgi:ribosomal protein S18 acetylase RimI-like enzyme
MFAWFVINQPRLNYTAFVSGEPAGYILGAMGGYGRRVFRYALPEVLLGLLHNPQILLRDRTYTLWTSYLRGLLPAPEDLSLRGALFATKQSEVSGEDCHARSTERPLAERPLAVTTEEPTILKASLASIAVRSRDQGRGIGKMLIRAFEEGAVERGATVLGLSVEEDNLSARRLYESCGWVLSKLNPERNSVYYIKTLRSAGGSE